MDRSAPFSLARERPKAWTLKRMAFHLGSPLVLQEFPELGKTMDLVIHGNTRNRRFLPGVKPAGGDAGPFGAPDIGGKAVADHEGFLRIKIRNLGKAPVEKGRAGLVGPQLLGDEHLLEVRADAGAF